MLAPCRVLVDVGSDHGHIPIAAVKREIAQHAVAADLRLAPLSVARRNIAAASVTGRVFMVRADGLSAFAPGTVDAVVMAGMSGEQIVRLCDGAPTLLNTVSQLLLQPNSDAAVVRRWALQRGLHLKNERMLVERGQFFVLCAFEPGSGRDAAYDSPAWSVSELCLLGPHLLARKDPCALRFFDWQCARLDALVDRRVQALEQELAIWQAARAFASAQ
jgi:tRNA A22 N-methylase